MANPNHCTHLRDRSGHFTWIRGDATPVPCGSPIQVTNTGSTSANPFTQPIEENPAKVEQRPTALTCPTLLILSMGEQDLQTSAILKGESDHFETERLT